MKGYFVKFNIEGEIFVVAENEEDAKEKTSELTTEYPIKELKGLIDLKDVKIKEVEEQEY